MTQEQRTDIKVGLTVLAGIAVLLVGIAWAKSWHLGTHEIVYRARFANIGGLEAGDPVTINGVKRGTVRSIELQSSDVLVLMEFPERLDLRSDASASIAMLELMSGKKVELEMGHAPSPFSANAIIPGRFAGDIGSLVEMVSGLSTSIQSITLRADTLFASLSGFMQGDTLKRKLNGTLNNADRSLNNIDVAALDASRFFKENGTEISETISRADSALRMLSAMAQENRAGLRVFVDSGTRAIADARRALSRIDSLFTSAQQNNSLLYRLTNDPEFAN
ncbi:MAG TPA: MlaD family protein, partial [Candidatus Kapabacteria bacterium]